MHSGRLPESRKPGDGSRQLRNGLEMFNLCRGNIHKTRSIRAHIEPCNIADNFPSLVPDRKAITQDGNFAGEAGKRDDHQDREHANPSPK